MAGPTRQARVGDIYAFELVGGRFGACQVVAHNPATRSWPRCGERVEIVSLDAIWEALPTIAQASQAVPLHRLGELDRWQVEPHPPWYALFVGNCAPVVTVKGSCLAFGGWRTNAGLPRRESEPTPVGLTPEITLDLGGGPWVEHREAWRVFLDPQQTGGGTVRWSELDRLPELYEISYTGEDAGLISYLRQRQLRTLYWHGHGQERLSLEGTSLSEITIDAISLRELLLPESLEWLTLHGHCTARVRAAREGRWIRLRVDAPDAHRSLEGLEGIHSLSLWTRRVSFGELSGYRDLRSLEVRGQFAALAQLDALPELRSLQELRIYDAYMFDAEELPLAQELPSLEHVAFDGFPKDAKKTIEKRLAGVPRIELRRPRSAAWVEDNRSNPFREWTDQDPRLGKAATAAWKAACAAMGRRDDARTALKTFIAAFNRYDTSIDTDGREQICDAFHDLARGFGVPENSAQDWLDEWREF